MKKKKKEGNNNNQQQYDSHKPAWRPDFSDVIHSTRPDKTMHDWAQSPTEAEYLISKLTINENALVVDPFLGSGTFLIPAIKLGRYAIGVEIDKEVFDRARSYIIKETTTTPTN